ncbi:hypothetical protein PAHAL_1G383000 [Panicum hallii]|uniref:Uncharacterized protein n=1 Tax=Panicum hallii TaxID=206008 RepID=A0A2T8KXS3_9POAL|nr:hypothetical protein PAHAL_1G383000 [Panicum hallii]
MNSQAVHRRRYSPSPSLPSLASALSMALASKQQLLLVCYHGVQEVESNQHVLHSKARRTWAGPLTRRVAPAVPRRMPPREPGAPRRGGGAKRRKETNVTWA